VGGLLCSPLNERQALSHWGNCRRKVDRITGEPGKTTEDERVAEGSVVVVTKRVMPVERRNPTIKRFL
jgi:hypothetical protein